MKLKTINTFAITYVFKQTLRHKQHVLLFFFQIPIYFMTKETGVRKKVSINMK